MNAIEKISEVTGLKRSEIDEIWQKVKDNQALLNGCDLHDFKAHERKYKCQNCGGTADSLAVSWYKKGLQHGLR